VGAGGSPELLGVLPGPEGVPPAGVGRPQDGSNDMQHPSTRFQRAGGTSPPNPPGSEDTLGLLSCHRLPASSTRFRRDVTSSCSFFGAPQHLLVALELQLVSSSITQTLRPRSCSPAEVSWCLSPSSSPTLGCLKLSPK